MKSSSHPEQPSKRRIAAAFDLKAASYDANAAMQADISSRLLARMAGIIDGTVHWADVGCGTGLMIRSLREIAPTIRLAGLDIARNPLLLLQENERRLPLVQGDIDMLPFKSARFDGIIVSSVLQWLANPSETIRSIGEVIRPGGHFAFGVFLTGSFSELFAVRSLFNLTIPASCIDPADFITALECASFETMAVEEAGETMFFPDPMALLKSIGRIGGTAIVDRRMTRGELRRFCDSYEREFRTDQGVPLTWKALIGVARKRENL